MLTCLFGYTALSVHGLKSGEGISDADRCLLTGSNSGAGTIEGIAKQ
jgi:hypothetical protein